MKYFIIVSIAIICITSSFWGCQKEDLGNLDGIFSDTAQAGPVSQMAARINGVPWSATSYDITLTPGSPGQIVITGQSDNGQTINLVVSNARQGDYLMSALSNNLATYSTDSTGTNDYKTGISKNTGGTVSIDSIDTVKQVMSGEFNFIGGLSGGALASITDGKFIDLGYVNASKNVEFGANVNGKNWIPSSVSASVNVSTGVLTVTAVNANGQKMVLSFPTSTKARTYLPYQLSSTGTYQASFTDNGSTLVPDALNSNNNPKLACSLKIISNTTTSPGNVKGTFSFYAAPVGQSNAKGVRIAAGQFNVNY